MKSAFVYEPHDFRGKVFNYNYCLGCGLIALRNSFTKWCIDKGCNNEDHPGYANQRKQATRR